MAPENSATRKRKFDTIMSNSNSKSQKKPKKDELIAKAEKLLLLLNIILDLPSLPSRTRPSVDFKRQTVEGIVVTEETTYNQEDLDILQLPLSFPQNLVESDQSRLSLLPPSLPFLHTCMHKGLDPNERRELKIAFNKANALLTSVAELYTPLLEYHKFPPPPSSYAKNSVWCIWQEKADAIQCLRPPHREGLPLCILDEVFRQFRLQVAEEFPATNEAAAAIESAHKLCCEMGNSFENEKARQKSFDQCIDSLFGTKDWRQQYTIDSKNEKCTAIVDRCLFVNDMLCIIREAKVDIGLGNDVYMQVSRDFQMYISYLHEERSTLLKYGAPTFLVCVFGPLLLIAGGFWDGKSVIVEPLGPAFMMFPDCSHDRIQTLARQLYALKQGVNTLSSRKPLIEPLISGVPRIYPSFIDPDSFTSSQEQSLSFIRPLQDCSSLMFLANVGNLEDPRLVKLVTGRYGTIVHKTLAAQGFAPTLYGQKSLKGAPTAYVMEYLAPPSGPLEAKGWVTLYKFSQSPGAIEHRNVIWAALDRILGVMQKEEVVHGDLRSNNLMVEVDADGGLSLGEGDIVSMKVVDFDWGGKSGE
ncbi:hypothetical protein FRC03_003504, partial [Tulasnella sp. 419]